MITIVVRLGPLTIIDADGSNVSSQPKFPTPTYQDVNCKLARQAPARSNSLDLGLHVPDPWTAARLVRHAPLSSHRINGSRMRQRTG